MTAPDAPSENRWRTLWRERRALMRGVWGAAAVLLLGDGWLLAQRVRDARVIDEADPRTTPRAPPRFAAERLRGDLPGTVATP